MEPRRCVTAIIVTYQSRDWIDACLTSLRDYSAAWIEECIISDNASNDGTIELIQSRHSWTAVRSNETNLGYGRAVNRAAKAASGEYLLILNPDAVLHDDAISEMIMFLDHRPEAAACGPQLLGPDGTFRPESRRGFPTPLNSIGYLLGLDRVLPRSRAISGYLCRWLPHELEIKTDCISGSCMMIRRTAFHDVGGFDEDYFLFGEDIDLCWKIAQSGGEIWYIPSARVTHAKGSSMKHASGIARKEFYRSMLIYIEKRLRGTYSHFVLGMMRMGVKCAAAMSKRYRVQSDRGASK